MKLGWAGSNQHTPLQALSSSTKELVSSRLFPLMRVTRSPVQRNSEAGPAEHRGSADRDHGTRGFTCSVTTGGHPPPPPLTLAWPTSSFLFIFAVEIIFLDFLVDLMITSGRLFQQATQIGIFPAESLPDRTSDT